MLCYRPAAFVVPEMKLDSGGPECVFFFPPADMHCWRPRSKSVYFHQLIPRCRIMSLAHSHSPIPDPFSHSCLKNDLHTKDEECSVFNRESMPRLFFVFFSISKSDESMCMLQTPPSLVLSLFSAKGGVFTQSVCVCVCMLTACSVTTSGTNFHLPYNRC